jgi:hypothetical protein
MVQPKVGECARFSSEIPSFLWQTPPIQGFMDHISPSEALNHDSGPTTALTPYIVPLIMI